MQLLDGKKTAAQITERLKKAIEALPEEVIKPHLAVVLVGQDPASRIYVRHKERACQKVGIRFTLFDFPDDVKFEELLDLVNNHINQSDDIHGCLIQLPLPKHLSNHQEQLLQALNPDKDVDGFHRENLGRLALNQPGFEPMIPATPYGIYILLQEYGIPIKGRHVCIIGKSRIVGQPLMILLAQEAGPNAPDATVTVCDRETKDLIGQTSRADILIVAAGRHHLINSPDMVKTGSTIIDVGIHRIDDPGKKSGYRLEGDVDPKAVENKADYLTPVPGGTGPMTVASLLLNTLKAYRRFHS